MYKDLRYWLTIQSSVSDLDPLKEMSPGSGSESAWTDADPDLGGKKAKEMYRFHKVNTELKEQK